MTGWVYLAIAFVSAFGLRDDLLTDKAIEWLGETIHSKNEVVGAGQVFADFDSNGTGRIVDNFADIGHSLWVVIVACLGGMAAKLLATRRSKENGIVSLETNLERVVPEKQ